MEHEILITINDLEKQKLMIDNSDTDGNIDDEFALSSNDGIDSESSTNSISLTDKLQANKPKNKIIIKNISNIREEDLKDLVEEFVDQLYFKSEFQNKVDVFEELKPDWLKSFIEKRNLDSKSLFQMMINHERGVSYF